MNQTSSTLGNTAMSSGTDAVSLLTTVHLAWIVVFALLVLAGIVYGSRVKHRRTTAERMVRRHVAEAGVETVASDPDEGGGEPAPAAATAALSADAPPAEVATSVNQPSAPVSGTDAAIGPVTQLKGLGPKVAARLAELGITTVGQLAALDDDGAQRLDAQMGPFRGRLERDRWIEQARFLAAGDVKGFEAVFGRL